MYIHIYNIYLCLYYIAYDTNDVELQVQINTSKNNRINVNLIIKSYVSKMYLLLKVLYTEKDVHRIVQVHSEGHHLSEYWYGLQCSNNSVYLNNKK